MFNSEKELVENIIEKINNKETKVEKFREKDFKIITELNLGFGIPDIILVNKNKKEAKRNNELSFFDISLLDIIKKEKEISIYDLVEITKAQKTKINNSLSLLINESIITKKESKKYKFNDYYNFITDCIAIEAKLKNWKRALKQAYRYKWFANESYVLLPEKNIGPAYKNLESFLKLNIGLLGLEKNGDIKIHLEANNNDPISEKMVYLLNENIINNY